MTMPTPTAFSGTVSVSDLQTAQGYIQAARDYYQTAFNAIPTGPLTSTARANMISGCSQLTSLISFAESILSQSSGTLTPSGGTGKGV